MIRDSASVVEDVSEGASHIHTPHTHTFFDAEWVGRLGRAGVEAQSQYILKSGGEVNKAGAV